MRPVFIIGKNIIGACGSSCQDHFDALLSHKKTWSCKNGYTIYPLEESVESAIKEISTERRLIGSDRTVLMSVLSARYAIKEVPNRKDLGVVIGSSRGVFSLLINEHEKFKETQKISPKIVPKVISGAMPSAIAKDLQLTGGNIFISAACSTGLHVLGTAFAFIRQGLMKGAVCGASEAPLTAFTLQQMHTIGVYDKETTNDVPYRPWGVDVSGMVPGEGAATIILHSEPSSEDTIYAEIKGYGLASETSGLTGITDDGLALKRACYQALEIADMTPQDIDLVIAHGAGTKKGDRAEINALNTLFSEKLPAICLNKWVTGHTLGASGLMAAAFATMHIKNNTQIFPLSPYRTKLANQKPNRSKINNVMICGLGFGGGAASIILSSHLRCGCFP